MRDLGRPEREQPARVARFRELGPRRTVGIVAHGFDAEREQVVFQRPRAALVGVVHRAVEGGERGIRVGVAEARGQPASTHAFGGLARVVGDGGKRGRGDEVSLPVGGNGHRERVERARVVDAARRVAARVRGLLEQAVLVGAGFGERDVAERLLHGAARGDSLLRGRIERVDGNRAGRRQRRARRKGLALRVHGAHAAQRERERVVLLPVAPGEDLLHGEAGQHGGLVVVAVLERRPLADRERERARAVRVGAHHVHAVLAGVVGHAARGKAGVGRGVLGDALAHDERPPHLAAQRHARAEGGEGDGAVRGVAGDDLLPDGGLRGGVDLLRDERERAGFERRSREAFVRDEREGAR